MNTKTEQKQNTTSGGIFDSIITKEIHEVPDCFKQYKDMDYRYVDVYSGSNVIARLALGIIGKTCLLHGITEKATVGVLKAFKTAYFSTVVSGLRDLGVAEVIAVHSEDAKWRKMIKMLLFSEPERVLVARMEI